MTQPLSRNWYRLKRRLASQGAARRDAAELRQERGGPRCAHRWTLVRVESTWSGPMRLSRCLDCQAVLQDWPASSSSSASEIAGSEGSAD
jgi:hypothetical protein